ncbi:MAG: gamma-glutamyltransferase [Gammaproteobacteria bacterium]|nr:gamma-glutamyltransferase [Gammaproteobacteria bacterium]
MTRVALASSSQISADAGAEIARAGGNAVDAAIAAAMVSAISEPGVCALGAGAYLTIWPVSGDPVTIDANVAVPGIGLEKEQLREMQLHSGRDVFMEYGGGIRTIVGHGSVATPGALAGCDLASKRYGALPWSPLLEPAINWARQGFPLSQASYNYLKYSHELVFGWNQQSYAALHDENGKVIRPPRLVHVEGLADSLEQIAAQGVSCFYRGDIAKLMVADIEENGGALTIADLAEYEALPRPCLRTRIQQWELATNPAPAIGGATLAAMLALMDADMADDWNAAEVARLAAVQLAVLGFRRDHLTNVDNPGPEIEELLSLAGSGRLDGMTAPSTVHVSAVDSTGLACAITMSAGYGSGVMPPGTGIWLNNCLGELELNASGLAADPPGRRLPSNMAPCVARSDNGRSLAIGSPGADRITSAILVTLLNFVHHGVSLPAAIEAPRLHVEYGDNGWRVAHEPGLSVEGIALPVRGFDALSMYFGGVGATLLHRDGTLEAAADPRRTGGTVITSA